MRRRAHVAVERASANDLMQLAVDAAGVPAQVGAILVLAPPRSSLDVAMLRAALERRVRTVPRLRQRLVHAPLSCGRPYWVDDGAFDTARHVSHTVIPSGGPDDLWRLAAALVTAPLPRDRPLWSITLVTGLASGETALVFVLHHVLADGIGGLAVLAALVDGPGLPVTVTTVGADLGSFPRAAPSRRDLLRDATSSRLAAVRSWRVRMRRLRDGMRELRTAPRLRAPRSSLNRPTSTHRAVAVARAPLAPLLGAAHRRGAKFNDVVLTAVGAALADLLDSRGEALRSLVVSVPVSGRSQASAEDLGNQVGAFPVSVPLTGDLADRLDAVAATTRARTAPSGSSAAVLEPAFRALASLRLLRPFVNRQHLVNTFVTNLHGPDAHVALLERPITDVMAVTISEGNVTVAFAVLSYAGTVSITVVVDPEAVTPAEHELVVARVEHHLATLAGPRSDVAPQRPAT